MNRLTLFFAVIGRWTCERLRCLGSFSLFILSAFTSIGRVRHPFAKIRQQVFFIGFKSLPVIIMTALFTGMVLGLQGQHILGNFGAEGLLGSAVAVALVRELGPVLTALMVVGQAGSSMTSEIGIMRNSEQIDALKTMAIDVTGFLVMPRMWAALLCFPLLTAIFDLIGITGGYLSGIVFMDADAGNYWHQVDYSLGASDVMEGFTKSLVFGLLVTATCCYHGFLVNERPNLFGSKGVSKVTTMAVVRSSILILTADFVVTALFI